MRKFFNISLIILLLLSTTGVAISNHYCGAILQKVTINEQHSCCDAKDMPDDCCSDQTNYFKSDHLIFSPLNISLEFSPYILYYTSFNFVELNLQNADHAHYMALINSFPIADPDIFARVQSFLL